MSPNALLKEMDRRLPLVDMEPAAIEEQRVINKCLSKFGKNSREIYADLSKVYGDDAQVVEKISRGPRKHRR